jgi:hypothetical protein
MGISAWVMLIIACVFIYGGLWLSIRNAIKSNKK